MCSSAADASCPNVLEHALRHRRACRENEAERTERGGAVRCQRLARPEHTVQRSRRCKDDGCVDGGTRVGERLGPERRRLRDVAVGNGDRDPERGPVQRKRRECGNETVVGADPVAVANSRELRRHGALVVEDALCRAGRARGEDDCRQRVGRLGEPGNDVGEQPACPREIGDVEPQAIL